MAEISAIIRFLSACYEADNRQAGIRNLLHKSVRHLQFFAGEEHLACGLLSQIPVDGQIGAAAMAEAGMFRREKTLVYAVFPVVGRLNDRKSRGSSTLCAPLFFYPARLLEEDGVIRLEADLLQQQVNVPVLSELLAVGGGDADLDELLGELPQAPFSKTDIQNLVFQLQDVLPGIDALRLAAFPRLDGDVPRQHSGAEQGRLRCLPACAMALVPNSPNTRGVLFELEQLADQDKLSAPLRTFLGGADGPSRRGRNEPTRVPTILSRAQRGVLQAAASSTLSLVVGPPGTGKSYTIAAAAVDHVARGESVLIACRKQQAVDVVARLVDLLLGPNQCVIHGGPAGNVRELKRFVEGMLQGIRQQIQLDAPDHGRSAATVDRELRDLDRELANAERRLTRRLLDEVNWAQLVSDRTPGLLRGWLRRWRRGRLTRRLERQDPVWTELQAYEQRLHASSDRTRALLKQRIDDRVQRTLQDHRRDLTRFLASIKSRSSTRQEKLFAEIDPALLFGTFPIWLTTVADVGELVPLEAEPFDLAIFDEATQCDLASCLPVLQRAKRAVIVGDPNQLRHVSFLSRERMRQLAAAEGLTEGELQAYHFRKKSFLDLANENIASQIDVQFLNEHFRCMPQIIRFSNEQFYQTSLTVMRSKPKTSSARCVFPHFVEGGEKTGGANPGEASALVELMRRHVLSQEELPASACQSIGVLSPFRDQVDLLARELERHLPLKAFDRHQVRVGTAHAFQGDERDVMYLSFVVDASAHHASLRFLDQPNLFNVAITRARHEQHVFYSIPPNRLGADSLFRQYLESIDTDQAVQPTREVVADTFLDEVRERLETDGFHVWPAYALGGVTIDLVAEKQGVSLGIDLIGFSAEYGDALDLERYRILRRAGFRLFPLSYRLWQQQPTVCLDALNAAVVSQSSRGFASES